MQKLIKQIDSQIKTHIAKVGEFIYDEFEKFHISHAEVKGKNDLVSYVDRESEQRLKEYCLKLISGSGILGEEGGSFNKDAEWIWIIDPLDGTTNYVHHIPVFCISVGLAYQGDVVAGYIYDPVRKELFWAHRNQGAYLNNRKITVSRPSSLNECVLATGYPFRIFENVDDYLQILKHFILQTRGIRRLGSAAIDLAYVAAGRFDGFFEAWLQPWDVAAGSLLVQEAGGIVTDYYGETNYLFGRSIIAATPNVYPQLRDAVQQIYLHR
jgi:myo-inositol-1(or 4)-monophosphatase